MKRALSFIVTALLWAASAVAQYGSCWTMDMSSEFYMDTTPYTFFVDRIEYRPLTDSTAEVYGHLNGAWPTPDLVVPQTVTDTSTNTTYTVVALGPNCLNGLNISSVVLPGTIGEIDGCAFINTTITTIELPANLRKLKSYAFSQCSTLTGTIVIPDSVEEIGRGTFRTTHVTAFATVNNPHYCTVDGVLYTADTTVLVMAPRNVGDTFVVPSPVRHIMSEALAHCTFHTLLLNDGLLSTGIYALPHSMSSIHLPASLEFIDGPLVDASAYGSLTVTIDENNTHYRVENDMLLSYDRDTLVMIFRRWNGIKALPEGIKVLGRELMSRGFYVQGNPVVGALALPIGLEVIGPWSLSALVEVQDIPSSVRKIDTGAFSTNASFDGNAGDLVLPAVLRELGPMAFDGTGIWTLVLPDSLTDIPYGAFSNCSFLNSVTFGSAVEHIGPEAFSNPYYSYYQYPLAFGTLPATLRTIGVRAFADRAISSVAFAGSPDTVGADAFPSCTTVTFGDTVPPVVYDGAFGTVATVRVPCGGTASFSAAPGWGPSLNYIESPCPPPSGIVDTDEDGAIVTVNGVDIIVGRADGQRVTVCDIVGRTLHDATGCATVHVTAPGIYIVSIHTPQGVATKKLVVAR